MLSKTSWILILSAIVLISLGVFELSYIDKSTEKLVKLINAIDASVASSDWKRSERSIAKLKTQWDKTSEAWSLFLNHREIDEINMSLARTQGYAVARDKAMLTTELLTMKVLVNHIPSIEGVHLRNIF